MTVEQKIEPALTVSEWAEMRKESERGDRDYEPSVEIELGRPVVGDGYVSDSALVVDDLRHALAALCLHSQSYGFTWADVDLLEERATELEVRAKNTSPTSGLSFDDAHYEAAAGDTDLALDFRLLADRIAALLPPREP